MSDTGAANDLRAGIARWQHKHGIADGDPALACLELFDLYVDSLRTRSSDGPPLHFEEFRSTLELLEARSKAFTKHAAELTHELRQATQMQSQLRRTNLLAFGLTASATFTVGLLVGIFLW